jgi:hypothetical protein
MTWRTGFKFCSNINNNPAQRIRPCGIQKLINFFKLKKTSFKIIGTFDILSSLPHTSHFPMSWKEVKITKLKPGNNPKLPQNFCPCPQQASYSRKYSENIRKA